jgi:hypothetical protein
MTRAVTVAPELAWLRFRPLGGDVAARIAQPHDVDANAALASIADESLLAEIASAKGDLDLARLLGITVSCVVEAATATGVGESLSRRLEAAVNDRHALAALRLDAHVARAAGLCTGGLLWAIDALLVAAMGRPDDARFACLEALRESGDLPGRRERWSFVTFAEVVDPHDIVEAFVGDPFHTGATWVGFRRLRECSLGEARAALVRVLEDLHPDVVPLRDAEKFPVAVTRTVDAGDIEWLRVFGIGDSRVWIDAGFVSVRIDDSKVMWSAADGPVDDPRGDRAVLEAVERAIEIEVRGTPWEEPFAEVRRVYPDRRTALRRHGSVEGIGRFGKWNVALAGLPERVTRELREMRR